MLRWYIFSFPCTKLSLLQSVFYQRCYSLVMVISSQGCIMPDIEVNVILAR